jgi:L-ascorbate metabolism protein UlaG (beta-lactamase superfamily)
MIYLFIFVAVVIGLVIFYQYYTRTMQFGGRLTEELKSRYNQSEHWQENRFMNLEETSMSIRPGEIPKLISKQFTNRKERSPGTILPVLPLDHKKFKESNIAFTWYGHSALLLTFNDKNLLIDPMFGPDASPIAPFAAKRFSDNTLELIDHLPKLDAVLLTHDHYDHLDLDSIKRLRDKSSTWMVSLGTARHLERWGINPETIQEFDWWDTVQFQNIHITFTPSRHFSGRGVSDRAGTLWGGWVFESEGKKIYWSGDSGYGSHFKDIGEKFGGFDLAFMECGQYNEKWHQIHMFPEESVQAAKDTYSKTAVPVHWGGFNLALHHWKDPIIRFVEEAKKHDLEIVTPRLGEVVVLNNYKSTSWWNDFD